MLSSGAQVSQDTQAAAALQEHHSTNYNLAGTPLQPRASDQLESLGRPLDPSDADAMRPEAMSGHYLLPGTTVANTLTVAADTPPQAMVRAETLHTNRQGAQAANEVQRAVAFQGPVVRAATEQQRMDQQRAQKGLANNLQYRDITAGQARSEAFLNDQMMARIGEREAIVLENMARRMAGAPNAGGMPINA